MARYGNKVATKLHDFDACFVQPRGDAMFSVTLTSAIGCGY